MLSYHLHYLAPGGPAHFVTTVDLEGISPLRHLDELAAILTLRAAKLDLDIETGGILCVTDVADRDTAPEMWAFPIEASGIRVLPERDA
jgi:hypothetical protein